MSSLSIASVNVTAVANYIQLRSPPLVLHIAYFINDLFVLAAPAAPEAEFMEHDSAVWALDVQSEGNLAVSGAEDGMMSSVIDVNCIL